MYGIFLQVQFRCDTLDRSKLRLKDLSALSFKTFDPLIATLTIRKLTVRRWKKAFSVQANFHHLGSPEQGRGVPLGANNK